MKKHLITLFICALFISPFFLFFSKNYKLLAEIIIGTWVSGYLFSMLTEIYFILNDTDSHDLAPDSENGWVLEYVEECCKKIGITNPPRIRIDKKDGTMQIIGTRFSSTIVISEDFIDYFNVETVKAGISHELGHLYLNHTLIKTFLYMFIAVPRFANQVSLYFIELLSLVIGLIPLIGWVINTILAIYYFLAAVIVMAFTSIISGIDFIISRHSEYEADKFSYVLGEHENLLHFFHYTEDLDKRSFFDFKIKSHPRTLNRKIKLQKYLSSIDDKYLNFDCSLP